LILGPEAQVLAVTQNERIKEEMIVAELDPKDLMDARSVPNYTLRTRRPELFDELVRNQVRF
jgi:predicted amidohydrolase